MNSLIAAILCVTIAVLGHAGNRLDDIFAIGSDARDIFEEAFDVRFPVDIEAIHVLDAADQKYLATGVPVKFPDQVISRSTYGAGGYDLLSRREAEIIPEFWHEGLRIGENFERIPNIVGWCGAVILDGHFGIAPIDPVIFPHLDAGYHDIGPELFLGSVGGDLVGFEGLMKSPFGVIDRQSSPNQTHRRHYNSDNRPSCRGPCSIRSFPLGAKIGVAIILAFSAWLVYGEWFCTALLNGWSGRNRITIVWRGFITILLFCTYFGYAAFMVWVHVY